MNKQGNAKNISTTVMAVVGILALSFPGAAFADQAVQWRKIVGIIQAGDTVGTGAGKVTGGGQPWYAISGSAAVDMTNGQLQFRICLPCRCRRSGGDD